MKKITTAMASAILMGATMTAGAQPPSVPANYAAGPLKNNGPLSIRINPGLFLAEETAYALIEGVMQAAEGVIYQGSCSGVVGATGARTWDLSVQVFSESPETGYAEISSNGVRQLRLDVVSATDVSPAVVHPGGTDISIRGGGKLNGAKSSFWSKTTFNVGGAMMVEKASFDTISVNNKKDDLDGLVIKDFWMEGANRPVPQIIDWGLQAVLKNDYPQDKWWQRSRSNRSNDVFGRTHFRKDRLYSAKNGGACSIDVDISGSNDADLFDQTGTFTIRKANPGPF